MRRRMSSDISVEDPLSIPASNSDASTVDKLEQELREIAEEKTSTVAQMQSLNEHISTLERALHNKESEVIELTTKIDELNTISPDAKEFKIIESLKNDLKVKSQEIQSKDKDIESKEEEIEDLEDEISSTKKKLSSAKLEIEDLTSKIEESEKRTKHLKQDLDDVKAELADLTVEDAIKSEAIEFVNAILQAKDADDRDAKTINEKIGKIESIIADQYIPLQRQYFGKDENIEEWINTVYAITYHWTNLQRKSWLKRKKIIAFIGEFSAGKTSIVNRILSQDEPDCPKLPVSSKATTAIATYISYGEGFNSQFTDANGDLKNLPPEMFTKVNKDILAKVNVSSIIQYFVMKYKNENLKGLSILDTPGFSSNDEQDKDRTLAVINEADALFWVVDANSGEINRTSLKIIADNITDIPLYVIINKADTKSPQELDKLENHLRETMRRAEIDVAEYVRFSQKAPLHNIMAVIETLPEARTGLDIGRICYDLQRDLNGLQSYLDILKKNLREIKNLLENREEILGQEIDAIVESCGRISSIPQYNSRLLKKDDYRMDQEEYSELIALCEAAVDDSSQAKECFDDYKEFFVEYHQITSEQSEKKEQYAATKNVYTLLMNAIKSLDPQLWQDIERAVKEALEEDARQT